MKREQKILATAVAALLGGGFSLQASAAFPSDHFNLTGSSAPSTITYASELHGTMDISNFQPIKIHLGPGLATDAQVIAGQDTGYVRIDLTNATVQDTPKLQGVGSWDNTGSGGTALSASATLDCPVNFGSGTTAGAGSAVTIGDIGISGGATGTASIIIGIKNPNNTGTVGIPAGCTIGIDLKKIKITDATKPVLLTYGLYGAPLAASQQKDALAVKANVALTATGPGTTFIKSPLGMDAVASVQKNFEYFKPADNSSLGGSTDATGYKAASFGAFQLKANAGVKNKSNAPVTLADVGTSTGIYSANSKLSLTGDFSSIWASVANPAQAGATNTNVFLSEKKTCDGMKIPGKWGAVQTSTVGTVTTTLAPTTVEFDQSTLLSTIASSSFVDGVVYACAQLGTQTVAINATQNPANFSVKFNATGNGDYGNATGIREVSLNAITRDGAVLESPFFSINPGFRSRMILAHLNPKAATDASFFITLRSDAGNHVQKMKEGVLKKGTIKEIFGNEIFEFPTDSARKRVGITVNLYALNDDVQGVIQHINDVTGEVTNLPMLRQGGGSGVSKK